MIDLDWLPVIEDWGTQLAAAKREGPAAWGKLRLLAASSIDFIQTEQLNRVLNKAFPGTPPSGLSAPPVSIAVVGSSTLAHLVPGLRVAAARRGIWADVYVADYGQYYQEIEWSGSGLWAFNPKVILIALDARHLFGGPLALSTSASDAIEQTLDRCEALWRLARERGVHVIHQTAMPVLPALAGSNEHRVDWSPNRMVQVYNEGLRERADMTNIDLLDLGPAIAADGLRQWHDHALWHRAKQEVTARAAPCWGDLAFRIIAARGGHSAKCVVLDLDNTLWGGVIGDDGLAGIVLGQGSPAGEAHLALQAYAKGLAKRGIILAVCSKNDEANALEPFLKHPDMILRREDITCFVANWDDKATNLRRIAAQLDIGIDSLLFVDDNPFERALVRRELPDVMVPELGEDPSNYVDTIAASGWLEAVSVTSDDLARTGQYQANAQREKVKNTITDMDAYLNSLSMKLRWRGFDPGGVSRIAQLINKSNQFNLTTRRYSEAEVEAVMNDPAAIHLQLRLSDSFGDNGMISVLIARCDEGREAIIDTWLMSCRVLGRGVETAALDLLVEQARERGFSRLVGRYLPSAKNSMVAEHYQKLGFTQIERGDDGSSLWQLDLSGHIPTGKHIECTEG